MPFHSYATDMLSGIYLELPINFLKIKDLFGKHSFKTLRYLLT